MLAASPELTAPLKNTSIPVTWCRLFVTGLIVVTATSGGCTVSSAVAEKPAIEAPMVDEPADALLASPEAAMVATSGDDETHVTPLVRVAVV